ncbi:hypothetical protein D3C83_330620 [compost metagenome]
MGVEVVVVKTPVNVIVEISDDTGGDGDRHPEDVNGDEELVLHHAAESDEQVVLDHGLA